MKKLIVATTMFCMTMSFNLVGEQAAEELVKQADQVSQPAAEALQKSDPSMLDQLNGVVDVIGNASQWPWQAVLISVLTLLISLVKSSWLKKYWDMLGDWKVLVAPVLSIGMVGLMVTPFSWKAFLFALTTGFGSVALHEFLDAVKGMKFVGPVYKNIIEMIGKLLKRPDLKK